MIKPDNLHYDLSKVLSYNKPFNFITSAREAGKTTAVWRYLYKKNCQSGATALIIRRHIQDISDVYINDAANVINKFLPDEQQIKFTFKKGSIKDGVIDVKVCMVNKDEKTSKEKLFFRVVALSNPLSRIKSLMLPNLSTVVFDEFICNNTSESYLKQEDLKFKELFNTFQRESKCLKCLFLGNPYSLYNPYFSWLNIPISKLYPGSFIVTDMAVVDNYKLKDELKEFIKARNPLYKFDDSYSAYAFDGRNINDEGFKVIDSQPDSYSLKYLFKFDGSLVNIYVNNDISKDLNKYWCCIDNNINSSKKVYCFDFSQLVDGTELLAPQQKIDFMPLKLAIMRRNIAFKDIAAGYAIQEIFKYI